MNPTISVQNVTKEFTYWSETPTSLKTLLVDTLKGKVKVGQKQKITVLRDVSFEISAGEFVGIMGRNGAGKSTVLKVICGIYQPTSGAVRVSGVIAPLIELGAGFHPELSGYENIFLNAAILGFGRKAAKEAVAEIIDFSELGKMIHMPIKHYSSGMLVRLGFSVATHLPAPVLIVDEVLAVGDMGFQQKCLQKIKSLHEDEGRTIVLVTHNPADVVAHCNRCIVIDQNRKAYDGSPKEGAEKYIQAIESGQKN